MSQAWIKSGERQVSLEELRDRAARAASGFLAEGVEVGDAVALLLRNDFPFLEATFGASWAGCYPVPINWHFRAREVRYILNDSGATHLVVHADLFYQLRDAIPEGVQILCVPTPPELCATYGVSPAQAQPPGDLLEWGSWLQRFPPRTERPAPFGSMFYTSGTTGLPKGVRRQAPSPDKVKAYGELRGQWFGYRPGMRTAMIGPMYHSVQSSYALAAAGGNGCVVLHPRFDAEQVLQAIDQERLTHLHLVPTMMSRLLRLPRAVRERYDPSSLEFVVHGAAPCPAEVKREIIEWWGPIIHEYYGTTEAGMVSRSSSQEWLEREGTVGKAWPGRTIRIYDSAGKLLPPNAPGEVYMSFGLVPDFTYHGAADRRAEIERDSLVTNGDIGYLDEDGYLFLLDRKSDMIITGGVNVYPAEIESVLATHPEVLDSAVFGVPDDDLGEVVAAAVQPVAGCHPSPDELKGYLGSRIARFKVPRDLRICDSLPRDDSGKIFKRKLRVGSAQS